MMGGKSSILSISNIFSCGNQWGNPNLGPSAAEKFLEMKKFKLKLG